MRRRLLALAAASAALLTVVPLPAARATVAVLVIDGRGFGHGVGMAQDGAKAMGLAGASTPQILGQFYPGTAIARQAGPVRVPVLVAPSRAAVVTFPNGGDIRDTPTGAQSPGFPVRVAPGGRVRLSYDGTYHVQVLSGAASTQSAEPAPRPAAASAKPAAAPLPPVDPTGPATTTTTTTSPPAPGDPPPTTAAPAPTASTSASSARPLIAVPANGGTTVVDARGRRYRGVVHADASRGPLRLVNELDVEQYLRGMGEVRDRRWPAPGLRAQAIVARTYALRAMATAGELCDDQRCQVYLGQQAEYPEMDKAVRDTQGQVLVYRGALATTVYSANGGGFEATAQEGFGPGAAGHPYLRAAPYPSTDPAPWTVRVALADVGRRFGYPGTVTGVRVAQVGPSGRALKVALDGSSGTRVVDGVRFDAGLGLRSTLFSVRVEQAGTAPAPPPAEALIQALPDQAAAARPEVPPDTPLEELPIQLREHPTTTSQPGLALPGAQRAAAPGRDPWPAVAVFLLTVAATMAAFTRPARLGRWRPRR